MNQQSILVSHAGGPEVMELGETPIAAPGDGQVLVAIEAVGVNFIETYQRSGVYAVDYPFTPGTEFSGTVTELGENVRHLKVGDRVATSSGTRGYAQFAVVDENQLGKVPDNVDLRLAAALPLQGMTSHYLTHSSYLVRSGDVILTYAGAGGVGLLLTQILKMKGATVITTASTQEKKDLARAAGADYVVDYDQVEATVDKVTEGTGVHAVYDGIGKDTFDISLKALRRRGTLVLFGGASGQVPPFDLQRLNAGGSLTVTRPKLADFLATDEERAWRFGDVFGWVASGELDIRVGQQFALKDAHKAHRALESRKTTGKVLLVP